MAKSDQEPSANRREDAKGKDESGGSSSKKTLMGIGERLRKARDGNRTKRGDDSNAGSAGPKKSRTGTNLSIPRPGDRAGDDATDLGDTPSDATDLGDTPSDATDLGDTPSDASTRRAHRRTAALTPDEARAAAQGDLSDTGPQTVEVTPDDEEEIEFLDDDAILEADPADEMEGEATMLSDNIFPASTEDTGPDPDYDVGKTEVSIQSLDDFAQAENRRSQGGSPGSAGRAEQQGPGDRRTAHLDQDDQPGNPQPGARKHTRQQFPDSPAQSGETSGSFPEPDDTPADRPSRRAQQNQQNQQNPPTPEAGRSGQINRADLSGSQAQANPDRSSRAFPKSPTPRDDAPPMGDTPDSGVQQPVDDFQDEKTEVFNSPYERETVVPKLSALSGPSSGQEFLLNKMRNSVGRGNNNSVMVPDLAMSRRHFEIAKNPDESLMLRDLQSANGTVVNGTGVKEAELIHGDRIEAGKTTFQFLHPDQQRASDGSRHLVPAGGTQPAASSPMKASSGQNQTVSDDDRTGKVLNYVIIIAMAVSVVLAVPVAYLLFFDDDDGGQANQPTAESLASNGASQDLIAVYLEGVQAVKDRDWDQAQARFEEVKSMDPDFERVNQQLARIRREKTNMSRLQKARTLVDNGEVSEAAGMAAKIGQESVYYEDAQAIVRRSKRVDIDERYQKAVTAFGEDEYDTAMNHVSAVLEEVPEHQGALELKDKVEESIAEAEAAEKEEAERAEEQSSNVVVRRRPPRDDDDSDDSSGSDGLFDMDGDWSGGSDSSNSGSSSPSASGDIDFSKGYSLYKAKSFTAAAAYFNGLARKHSGGDASKAKTKASSVRKFQSAYESANAAYGRGDYNAAIKDYTSARSHDKKVSGSGHFQSALANKLANSYGKRGLAQLRQGQYSAAYKSYRSGKRYSSANSTLRTLRQNLTNKARSLYIQAANKRKTDPTKARALCDTITSMIPPSEPTYQKAKKLQGQL
jgi:pSer/pThr/pTyr-binding forkhead associated (FHA) protein